MSQNFAFYDVRTADLDASRRFRTEMPGWPVIESPAGPALGDGSGPRGGFTPSAEGDPRRPQWIPCVPAADVAAAAGQAVTLGARVVRPRTGSPPGPVVVIDEPGGATLALWRAAEQQ